MKTKISIRLSSLTQVTLNRTDKDPASVTKDLESNKTVLALPFIDRQEMPTSITQSTFSSMKIIIIELKIKIIKIKSRNIQQK